MSERKDAPAASSPPVEDKSAAAPSFADTVSGAHSDSPAPKGPDAEQAAEPLISGDDPQKDALLNDTLPEDALREDAAPLSETVGDTEGVHPGLLASLNASYTYAVHGIAAEDALEETATEAAPEDATAEHTPEDPAAGDNALPAENAGGSNAEESAAPPAGADEGDNAPAVASETGGAGAPPTDGDGTAKAAEEEEDDDEWEDEEDEEEDKEEEESEPKPMTLRDHLRELRKRLFRAFLCVLGGFFVGYPFAKDIFKILVLPLKKSMHENSHFIFTSPGEAFLTYMKVAFVAGFFATSPLIFYQIWSFIAPGLYKEEKRYVLPLAFFSALFFICGGAFCYFVVFPVAFEFFMGFSDGEILGMPSLRESLNFILRMLFAFGLVFELPLFVFFLARMGLVTAPMMRRFRRYAVLVNVIVAAVLTPPDITSQMLMAGPLLVLYEVGIIIAAVFGRQKPKEDEGESEDKATAT